MAAAAPTVTSVTARPRLKQITIIAPKVTCFTCRHSSNTVMAAGQGISPPGQAEHQDLAIADLAMDEALANVVGMGLFMGVLIAFGAQVQAVQITVVMAVIVTMLVLMGVHAVLMAMACMPVTEPGTFDLIQLLATPGAP
ncbi:hypothetical protein IBA8401_02340 [Pseudomonas syringae]